MNDALLQEIRLAYQTQNLRPIRRSFFLHDDSGDFACPLVALAAHRGLVSTSGPGIGLDGGANPALDCLAEALGEEFTIGLLDGFDGQMQAKNDPNYLRGHALGLEAARQLAPRDPAA